MASCCQPHWTGPDTRSWLTTVTLTPGPAGYSPLFMSGHWHAAEEARCGEVLRSLRVDGLIVLTGRLSDATLRSLARALPVVVTDGRLRPADLFSIEFDNREGARLATRHLLDLGHERIAFIAGDPAHPDAVHRQRGYELALQAAGLPVDSAGLILAGDFTAHSDLAAAVGLHRQGRLVPEDVSLVGFDDLGACGFFVPPRPRSTTRSARSGN